MSKLYEFQKYLEENQAILQAYGDYVAEKIKDDLAQKIRPLELNEFLKIEAKPRVKGIYSALAKVGRKNYIDPFVEMTDLVGIRFVVLLVEQIDIVCQVIEDSKLWDAKVAKDFSDEIDERPQVFDYQSKHYEIRLINRIKIDDKEIPSNLCCEVQIRSLLQHAYAELVHDNIYKPEGRVPACAEREVAKSMALMETTDDIFSKTLKMLKEANEPDAKFLADLSELYKLFISINPKIDKRTNFIFFEEYIDYIDDNSILNIKIFLEVKGFVAGAIKEKASESYFFKQPVILFIYYLVDEYGADIIKNQWPLPAYNRELDWIFSDLDKRPSL